LISFDLSRGIEALPSSDGSQWRLAEYGFDPVVDGKVNSPGGKIT
jgi:hypothetical protein